MLRKKRPQKLILKAKIFDRKMLIVVFAVGLLFLFCPIPGETAEQKGTEPQNTTAPAAAPAPAPATPSGPSAIPVADIATQATEVANLLQTMTQKLAASPQVEMIRELLPDVSRQIDQDMAATISNCGHGQTSLTTGPRSGANWRRPSTMRCAQPA